MSNPVILQIPVGDYQVLTHLVACPVTREAVIIDPAGEPEKILQQVEDGGFKIRLSRSGVLQGPIVHGTASESYRPPHRLPYAKHGGASDAP